MKDYCLSDYNIQITNSNNYKGKFVAYIEEIKRVCTIIDMKEEAFEALLPLFNIAVEDMIKEGVQVPLPGTPSPQVTFASTEIISNYRDIVKDFVKKIFDTPSDNVFISDKSELSSYEHLFLKGKEELINRIETVYGIDVTEIYYEPLYKIIQRLENAGIANNFEK